MDRDLIDTCHPQVVQGINRKQVVSELCARHAVYILHGLAGQLLIRRHPLPNLATQAVQQLSELSSWWSCVAGAGLAGISSPKNTALKPFYDKYHMGSCCFAPACLDFYRALPL